MKLWVALVTATLLAGCGAAPLPTVSPAPPSPSPSLSPSPPHLGFWGILGGGARNSTTPNGGGELVLRLRRLVTSLVHNVLSEAQAARARAAEYGAEMRTWLEQSWGDLKNRGVAYGRKLRRRLNRDGDDIRRRWGALGGVWGGPPAPTLQEA